MDWIMRIVTSNWYLLIFGCFNLGLALGGIWNPKPYLLINGLCAIYLFRQIRVSKSE